MALMKKIEWRKVLCYCTVFVLFFYGWCFRNYQATGVFEFSTVRNYNLMAWDASFLRGSIENIEREEACEKFERELEEEYGEEIKTLNEPQLYRIYAKVGTKYIKEHFSQFLIQNIIGMRNEMFTPEKKLLYNSIGNETVSYVVMRLYQLYLGFVYILYAMGFLKSIRKLNIVDLFIFTVSGYCAAASASLGNARFRAAWFGLVLVGAFLLISKRKMSD